jgi:hypothetical protein
MLKNKKNLQCRHKYDDTECMQGNIIKLCYGAISTEHNILCTTQQLIRNSLRKWFDGNNSYCDDIGALYLTLHMGEFLLLIFGLFTEAFKVKQLLPNSYCVNCGVNPWIMKGKKVNKVVMAQLKMPAWNVSGVNDKMK